PKRVTTPRWLGEIECIEVASSHSTTSATATHRKIDPLGLAGRPPCPPPPKRMRPRRRSSSSGVTPERPPDRPPPAEGSPHGPWPWPSSCGSSPLPVGPQGPLSSVKKPRLRPTHPRNLLIGVDYRERAARKTVASGGAAPMCRSWTAAP